MTPCKMVKNRAVVDAVTAPSSRQAKDRHPSRKTSEQFALFRCERVARMHCLPAVALSSCGNTVEEGPVGQSFREDFRPVDHRDAREEDDFRLARRIRRSPRFSHTSIDRVKSSRATRARQGACTGGRERFRFRRCGRSIRRSRTELIDWQAGKRSRDRLQGAGEAGSGALNRCQLGPGDLLGAIGLTLDQDEHNGCCPVRRFFQGQGGQRRLRKGGLEDFGSELARRRSQDRRASSREFRKCQVVE